MITKIDLDKLANSLEGELQYDDLARTLYATDASVYRKLPLAVAYPKNEKDIKSIIAFCHTHKTSIIPRTAGTSLAGQCVGDGIVVDVSKHFNKILSLNKEAKTIIVEPGVVRDELNEFLKPHGLFFGPNTSTSNRCMIGGMVGNNSSGTTSIKYGTTRDKTLSLHTVLSDGSAVVFEALSNEDFEKKRKLETLESNLYNAIHNELSNTEQAIEIKTKFPRPSIHRRNTGYAVDELLNTAKFADVITKFNFSKLLSGSEGTLAFTTKIELQLDDIQPAYAIMVAPHFESVLESLKAVVVAMQHNLYTCELMDKVILDCTKNNIEQSKNRFFIEGDPKAILMLEIRHDHEETAINQATALIEELKANNFGYKYPVLKGGEIESINTLRKAGLGLLGNIIGDKKAVACIEDTAVEVKDLPEYIDRFAAIMKKYDQEAVYYAHAGAGEIHLRPILNLKKKEDVVLFRKISTETAALVKEFGGSLSGEHGDGIVRAEFIPMMIGEKNYDLLKRVKHAFDPHNIFNPGKIVNAAPMDESLRYEIERKEPEIKTLMDFSESQGILRAAEKCNGSGDCRKLSFAGGTMCPSFRATRNEKDTTRGRANTLREYLTKQKSPNPFDHQEIKEVMSLCLSCKACASECPSNVDIAALKAEFLYQYQKENGISLRTKLFAYNNNLNEIGRKLRGVTNFAFTNRFTARILKTLSGVALQRSLPTLSNISLRKWYKSNIDHIQPKKAIKTVYFYCDEFTNQLDADIGIDAIELLCMLGYKVKMIADKESGRAFISKGLLEQAKLFANENVNIYKNLLSDTTPLVGIEPSAILTFRDEYLKLVVDKIGAQKVASASFIIEEFLATEMTAGNIKQSSFSENSAKISLHGHCHQKALSSVNYSKEILDFPKNYTVTVIPSGCCGMAGSFGYEKEHYAISMNIGEQTLFPALRKTDAKTLIAAPGTSCRHQIYDGTKRIAVHPVSILRSALK